MAKCDCTKSGGIVVITKTFSALCWWVLSYDLGFHIGAQTSTMSFNIHHDDRLIHRESVRGTQQQNNEAENALHYKTLGCCSLRQKIPPATSEIVSCPSCSKGHTQVEKFVECNGGYFLQTEKKNGIRKLKVLEIASRKTALQVDKKILCCLVTAYDFRSDVKMQAILNHELMPLPLSLAEIISHNLRTGNNSF